MELSACQRCGSSDQLKTMQFNLKGIAALATRWPALGALLRLGTKRLCVKCRGEYVCLSAKHTNLANLEAQERYLAEIIPWYQATPPVVAGA